MLPLFIIAPLCIVLYAVYWVFGPFSYGDKRFWDNLVHIVAAVLWIGLSIAFAILLVPTQSTVFLDIVCTAGVTLATMLAISLVFMLIGVFLQWIYLSVIPSMKSFPTRKKNI